mgnify:CR=1 FL=1
MLQDGCILIGKPRKKAFIRIEKNQEAVRAGKRREIRQMGEEGKLKQDGVGQSSSDQNRPGQDSAGQGRPGQNRSEQNRPDRNRSEQNSQKQINARNQARMSGVCLFAGTTEGRLLAQKLASLKIRADVFAATEYGKEQIEPEKGLSVFARRLTEPEMEEAFRMAGYKLVLDATHPYAREVSENIRRACEKTEVPMLRVLRDEECGQLKEPEKDNEGQSGIFYADSLSQAVEFLKSKEGRILAATGSKELAAFHALPDWKERVFARVLPLPEVVEACSRMGFSGNRLIAMQGPFPMDLNLAMLKAVKARWMVTKDSGRTGGFLEKQEAARLAGAGLVVIRRPKETGISLEEAFRYLEKQAASLRCSGGGERKASGKYPEAADEKDVGQASGKYPEADEKDVGQVWAGTVGKRTIWLVGTGPGNPGLLTEEAREALSSCSLIAGSRRCISQLAFLKKETYEEYRPKEILSYLSVHPEHQKICVALSGDTGFYSGASSLIQAFSGLSETEVRVLPGISSVSYFFSRIGKSWERVRLLSLHGRDMDVVRALKDQGAVFLLGGEPDVAARVSEKLLKAGLEDARMTVGENLSLKDERIFSGSPHELSGTRTGPLTVLYLEWDRAGRETICHGLPDSSFIRGEVPMTKQEVRSVAISKLAPGRNSVIWDVGAGTGSVSIECARLSEQIRVFAIERKPEAAELLKANREAFGLSNMEILEGEAPECLRDLPDPTHVFLGGSGGGMEGILKAALEKNAGVRFVATVISLESMVRLTECIRELPVGEPDLVQLTAARARKAGRSHLMTGQNPVWIFSFEGTGNGEETDHE